MKTKPVGWVALTTLILTSIWLVLVIVDMACAGPLDTYEQMLAHVSRLDGLYYTIYLATGLLTVTTAMLMAGLYGLYRQSAPAAALFGGVFVPVYAALNLLVYFSQAAIIPSLIVQQQAAPLPAVTALLQQMIHQASGSLAGFANALAYAVLGIPSLIFGVLMWQQGSVPACSQGNGPWRAAGLLMALSGLFSLAGFLALFVGNAVLNIALVAGSAIYWLALFPLSYALLCDKPEPQI